MQRLDTRGASVLSMQGYESMMKHLQTGARGRWRYAAKATLQEQRVLRVLHGARSSAADPHRTSSSSPSPGADCTGQDRSHPTPPAIDAHGNANSIVAQKPGGGAAESAFLC